MKVLHLTKRCPCCGRELPLDAFSAHRYGRHGRRSWCRECVSQKGKARRAASAAARASEPKPESPVVVAPAAELRCSACGRCLPASSFPRDASKASGRKSWCRECVSEKGKERRAARVPAPEPSSADLARKRLCPCCERELPLAFFPRDASKASGRKSWCRECVAEKRKESAGARRAARRARRQAEAERVLAAGVKVCRACAESLPLESFRARRDSLDGRGRTCTPCLQEVATAPDPEDEERVERWNAREADFERRLAAVLGGGA